MTGNAWKEEMIVEWVVKSREGIRTEGGNSDGMYVCRDGSEVEKGKRVDMEEILTGSVGGGEIGLVDRGEIKEGKEMAGAEVLGKEAEKIGRNARKEGRDCRRHREGGDTHKWGWREGRRDRGREGARVRGMEGG